MVLAGGGAVALGHVPEAAVALKQGAGRLIRSEADRGVLVICDTRLVAMGYGRRLLKALPPMRRIEGEDQVTLKITVAEIRREMFISPVRSGQVSPRRGSVQREKNSSG